MTKVLKPGNTLSGFFFYVLSLILFSCVLTACKSTDPSWYALQSLLSKTEPKLNPSFEYITVELDGRTSRLVLGYREFVQGKPLEHWYSGAGEMLEMFDGRVHKALGMTLEIRGNKGRPPAWESFNDTRQTQVWTREIDIMPGYRYGVEEEITTVKLSKDNLPVQKTKYPKDAIWFQDRVITKDIQGKKQQFQQLFAVLNNRVIYSEQCLHKNMCMSFQRDQQAAR